MFSVFVLFVYFMQFMQHNQHVFYSLLDFGSRESLRLQYNSLIM